MTQTGTKTSRNETTEWMLLRVMRIAELLVRATPSEQGFHPARRDGTNPMETHSTGQQAKNAPIVQLREKDVR